MDKYSRIIAGSKYSKTFKVYITENKKIISPFHDIPYKKGDFFYCVNEIPRFENAKFEINKKELFNPITQDIKKEKIRFVKNLYPAHGYLFNYGAIPQTWENPKEKDEKIGALGDNDPIDVFEIGNSVKEVGEVYKAKVLGSFAMLDGGEADWKIIAIDIKDELADKLNNIEDIKKHCPNLIETLFAWLRDYKRPDGNPCNEFAFDGKFLDAETSKAVIEQTHLHWKELMINGHEGISLANKTQQNSQNEDFNVEKEEEKETERPKSVFEFSYIGQ